MKKFEVYYADSKGELFRHEGGNEIAFERTFKISEEKKIFNIIKELKLKNIKFETYYINDPEIFKGEFIKLYGKSNKTSTLEKLGFNLFPLDYSFTWDWKLIDDLELFFKLHKYNI